MTLAPASILHQQYFRKLENDELNSNYETFNLKTVPQWQLSASMYEHSQQLNLSYHKCIQVGLVGAASLNKGGIGIKGSTGVDISGRNSEAAATTTGHSSQPEGDGGRDWYSGLTAANKDRCCTSLDQSLETCLT